jgi:hypothetical protein
MHDPGFRQQFVAHHTHQLEGRGRHARPSWAPERAAEDVTLRLCTVQDDPALERLAQLESRALPAGRFVVAEVDGELIAAVPLVGGRAFADPFRKTAHLMPLLRRRARQLEPRHRSWHRLPVPHWKAA